MTLLHVFALSLIQGLTEFLPVSSSGHLVILPLLLDAADQGILIDVALHAGTLLAILVYCRRDIFGIAASFLFFRDATRATERKLGWFIAIASIPAVLAGLAVHHFFPGGIRGVEIITATTLIFGLLMGIADIAGKSDKTIKDITLAEAFAIGLAQALALVPGTSRSGVTMTAARLLGIGRKEAARFSFLLGIPAMTGAALLGLMELAKADDPGLWHDAALAAGLSFVFGLAAIHLMISWIGRMGLMPFVVYRMFLGGALLAYFVI